MIDYFWNGPYIDKPKKGGKHVQQRRRKQKQNRTVGRKSRNINMLLSATKNIIFIK